MAEPLPREAQAGSRWFVASSDTEHRGGASACRSVMVEPPVTAPGSDVLLATKLHMPGPRPGLVPRPRLMARLDEGLARGLVLVCGPAGYGKTVLLAEWARRGELPAAWLSLDAGDNDPARFWPVTYVWRLVPGTSRSRATGPGSEDTGERARHPFGTDEFRAPPGDVVPGPDVQARLGRRDPRRRVVLRPAAPFLRRRHARHARPRRDHVPGRERGLHRPRDQAHHRAAARRGGCCRRGRCRRSASASRVTSTPSSCSSAEELG